MFVIYSICKCVHLCEFMCTVCVQEEARRGMGFPELDLHALVSYHVEPGPLQE